jgi:hypothetical protein
MFDRAACCHMRPADAPAARTADLRCLRDLSHQATSGRQGDMVENRYPSLSPGGGADGPIPRSRVTGPTGPVSRPLNDPGLGAAPAGGAAQAPPTCTGPSPCRQPGSPHRSRRPRPGRPPAAKSLSRPEPIEPSPARTLHRGAERLRVARRRTWSFPTNSAAWPESPRLPRIGRRKLP